MKKSLLLVLAFALPFTSFGQAAKKLLVIGVDGCRPDALQVANTPIMDQLISTGIFSPDALNDDITISGPGWSAILCGVWSDKHLVTGNNFTINDYENYPPFFNFIEDYDPGSHKVSICHWGPINNSIIQDHADFKLNVATDAEVGSQASAYLKINDPDVVFLHFDDVDHAGHSYGFSPTVPEYLAAIESVDTHIGTVLEALGQRPTYAEEDWLILVTTDHGGNGTGHGGNTLQEQRVFVIASGPSVVPALILRDSMIVLDKIANCLNDSMELQFDGADDRVQIAPNSLFNFGSDQDFTVECRVRTNSSGDYAIVGNKDWTSGLNKGFVFSFKYPSGPQWKVNIGDGSNRADINTGGAIADGAWHTLSVTFDRDGLMKLYQDGILLDSASISSIGDIDTNEGLSFGTDIEGDYDYPGSLAEIRVWNAVLDAQAIADWHCSALENSHPFYDQLIGYWKLNEGAGAVEVTDHSGNGNPGQIVGATWINPDSGYVVYDYSATPRLTDIVPTALNHLCIPIQEDWALDGNALLPECITTHTENASLTDKQPTLLLFPNPVRDQLQVNLSGFDLSEPAHLEVYNPIGQRIFQQTVTQAEWTIPLADRASGLYWLTLRIGEQRVSMPFVKE